MFTVDMYTVNENMVGIVTTLDGLPIEEETLRTGSGIAQ